MKRTVELSEFVGRQTSRSRFSHYGGSQWEIIDMVQRNWSRGKPGYRDGVVLVPVPPRNSSHTRLPLCSDIPGQ